jgi:methylmalonyl-CoA/ethylmalonyl-CoA epimerase
MARRWGEELKTLRLHHIGFVIDSIERSGNRFAQSLGLSWNQKVFFDSLQRVNVTFMNSADHTDPQIELVEPCGEDSPVRPFLLKGGGLHHLCYEVQSLETQLETSRSQGGKLVRPPMPAVAFDGRRIAWIYSKERLLIEFLESDK